MSQDYLRALSLFKRKLQLLGFYPIVLNDDGLEYVSMEPYLIEDDYDDRMYKLLKEMKKEKKARKKAQKKKAKKSKKTTTEKPPPATTTTVSPTSVQPISNIVYYWPSTITTIVHPGQSEATTTGTSYQHSFDTRINIKESSSEEDSSEVDSNSSDQINKNDKQKPAKINYATRFSFERKFNFGDGDTRAIDSETTRPSISTTTTTTPYPLITVFPDPEEVAIQEILDQQEIVNKISDESEKHDEGSGTKTISNEQQQIDDLTTDELSSVQDNSNDPHYMKMPTLSGDSTKIEANASMESVLLESTNPDTPTSSHVTESAVYASESPLLIPTGALQFFHETLPDDESSNPAISASPSLSEIVTNVPISTSTDVHISDEVEEATENDNNTDGHRDVDTQPNYSAVQLNDEITTPLQPIVDEHLTTSPLKPSDDKIYTQLEITAPMTGENGNDAEGYQYLIDPKITLESRSLTDEPVLVAVIVEDDKSGGRRSDVPIEADDINDEDTTDNLAYNLTGENLLERSSNVVESKFRSTFRLRRDKGKDKFLIKVSLHFSLQTHQSNRARHSQQII